MAGKCYKKMSFRPNVVPNQLFVVRMFCSLLCGFVVFVQSSTFVMLIVPIEDNINQQ